MVPLLVAALLFRQDRSVKYPDIPENHVTYDALKKLKSDGLLPELYYDIHLIGNKPLGRFEVGNLIVHAELNVGVKMADVWVPISDPRHQTRDEFRELQKDLDLVRKLTHAFQSDLPKYVDYKALVVEQDKFFKRLKDVLKILDEVR